jgi:hypothetical protein
VFLLHFDSILNNIAQRFLVKELEQFRLLLAATQRFEQRTRAQCGADAVQYVRGSNPPSARFLFPHLTLFRSTCNEALAQFLLDADGLAGEQRRSTNEHRHMCFR